MLILTATMFTTWFNPFRGAALRSAIVALLPCWLAAQPQEGPPPGGPGFGGDFLVGGPGGPMGRELKLVQQFDRDGDNRLDAAERKAARDWLSNERAQGRGGPRGFGPRGGRGFRGFGGRGENQAPPQPGERIAPSDVEALTDVPLYEPLSLRTLFLDFESPDWEQELSDFNNTDVDVPARLIVDGKTYLDVGVHFRGMTSFMMVPEGRKRPLNLSLDYVHDDQRLNGYRTLNLLNAHEDPSFLRTVLYFHVVREYIPAPKANFVRVVINGENWGVYVNAQQFNKDFIRDNYGSNKGARWKVQGSPGGRGGLEYFGDDPQAYKAIYTIKSKDDTEDWAAFIHMLKILNETPSNELESKLSPLLDIDGALKFLALDITLINNDGYWIRASDYSILRDPTGKFHIVPHDANETFAMPGGPGFGGGPGGPGGPGFGPGMMLAGQMISQGDQDGDGKLSRTEMTKLADAWFDKLDAGKSGHITQDELVQNFGELLPPPPGFGPRGGGPRGLGPGNFLGPGFFTATDSNRDGSLTKDELRSTFAGWATRWDEDQNGAVDEQHIRDGLNAVLPQPAFGGFRGGRRGDGRGPGGRGGFGGGRGRGPSVEGVRLDPLYIAGDPSRPLASKLLSVPALRERYLGYVRDIAENWLDWSKLGPVAEQYHNVIAAAVERDTRKLDSTEAFEKSLTETQANGAGFGPRQTISLKEFADQRREYLLNLPAIKDLPR